MHSSHPRRACAERVGLDHDAKTEFPCPKINSIGSTSHPRRACAERVGLDHYAKTEFPCAKTTV